jgi:DNA mismatch endonuclease (patch repair protein)
MAAIRGKDTKPEIAVRAMLDAMSVRYDLHRSDLPGKPDIVLSKDKKIIFVHGCFWHLHRCRYGKVKPASNAKFWKDKRESNRLRDIRNRAALKKEGWRLLTVWECWTKEPKKLTERLVSFLSAWLF